MEKICDKLFLLHSSLTSYLLSNPASGWNEDAKGRDDGHGLERDKGAHRAREEYSLDLGRARPWRFAVPPFPDRSEKNPEVQWAAQGRDVGASGT